MKDESPKPDFDSKAFSDFQYVVNEFISEEEAFFASLLENIPVRSTKDIPTAGIGVFNDELILLINHEFWLSLPSLEAKKALLLHEVLHAVLGHLEARFKPHNFKRPPEASRLNARQVQQILNVAMDIVVHDVMNDHAFKALQAAAPTICHHEMEALKPEDRLAGKNVEFYFNALLKGLKQDDNKQQSGSSADNQNGQQGDPDDSQQEQASGGEQDSNSNGSGSEIPDSLDQHFPSDSADSSQTDDLVKDWIKESSKGKDFGKLPARLQKRIDELTKDETIPWTILLKRYIGTTLSSFSKKTYRRRNKRFSQSEFIFKGSKADHQVSIIVYVDSSGSVSDSDFKKFMNLIYSLSDNDVSIRFILFDASVSLDKDLKRARKSSLLSIKRSYGGTDFQAAFNHSINKSYKPDLNMVFTDGYAPPPSNYPAGQTLWILTEGENHYTKSFKGKKITIDKKRT